VRVGSNAHSCEEKEFVEEEVDIAVLAPMKTLFDLVLLLSLYPVVVGFQRHFEDLV